MTAIIIKNYSHINSSFPNWDTPTGKLVKNKDHYDRLMKENNFVSSEKSRNSGHAPKPFTVSKKALAIIEAARNTKDKKGNVKLNEKMIEGMKEIGAIKKIPTYMRLPAAYNKKGGF